MPPVTADVAHQVMHLLLLSVIWLIMYIEPQLVLLFKDQDAPISICWELSILKLCVATTHKLFQLRAIKITLIVKMALDISIMTPLLKTVTAALRLMQWPTLKQWLDIKSISSKVKIVNVARLLPHWLQILGIKHILTIKLERVF